MTSLFPLNFSGVVLVVDGLPWAFGKVEASLLLGCPIAPAGDRNAASESPATSSSRLRVKAAMMTKDDPSFMMEIVP
jgi:hypothetical protein